MLSLIINPDFHIIIGSQIGEDNIIINSVINQFNINMIIFINLIIKSFMYVILNIRLFH